MFWQKRSVSSFHSFSFFQFQVYELVSKWKTKERDTFDIVVDLETMWATTTTVSFPFYTKAKPPNSLSSFATNNRNSLKLKASLSDYPLASRIMVRSKLNLNLLIDLSSGYSLIRGIMRSADLPYSTNESSLQQQFSNFGQIAEGKCHIRSLNFDGRVIYVELAKPGGDASKGYLRTLGPPKVPHLHFQEQDEVPDCWY
ncbi:hypothetical protein CFP56_002193 [Quercus suber]|uniref:RRM domain-containing protein n=1 Tax=Quercus suber TaxID=58331 RepID=A0AAW0MA74_QUESU